MDAICANGSPSSRRAWIEIVGNRVWLAPVVVALLAEGVDRNGAVAGLATGAEGSPSSRRAWIEISSVCAVCSSSAGRPPRGGRG